MIQVLLFIPAFIVGILGFSGTVSLNKEMKQILGIMIDFKVERKIYEGQLYKQLNASQDINNTNSDQDSKLREYEEKITNSNNSLNSQIKELKNQITELLNKNTDLNQKVSTQIPIVDGINLQNYMYRDCVIYHQIFTALQQKIIEKIGSPPGWDEGTFSKNKWNGENILRIGLGIQINDNGLLVHVPSEYNVLWIRVLNDRYQAFRVVSNNYTDKKVAIYVCGFRNLNEISPDGGGIDRYTSLHVWCPIPLYFAGDTMVYSERETDNWISGIAFGYNLWNHAKNSAIAYFWQINEGTPLLWDSDNWQNDQLGGIPFGKISELYVPVVPSNQNKILYIIEHNNNSVGTMHGDVKVNNEIVERFRTSYNNPFAVHYNSKIYNRYMATYIPADFIPADAKFIKLTIDLTRSNQNIYFREIGTHDYKINYKYVNN